MTITRQQDDFIDSQPNEQLAIQRSPDVVLAEAKRAATALQQIIAAKPKPVIFNGEQYLEFEDWQTVARFYGYVARVATTSPVEFGGVHGFEARADVVDARTGIIVSSADAMCLNDEEKWRARPKYEYQYELKDGTRCTGDPADKSQIVWIPNPNKPGKTMPKKERVLVGEEAVPLFQLRSMAQTRACAKALRNVLAWVVVLAGYRPTPAEELPSEGHQEPAKPPIQPPQRKSGNGQTQAPGQEAQPSGDVISDAQRKRFYAIYKQAGWKDSEVKEWLLAEYGIEHSNEIPKSKYDAICSAMEAGGQPEPGSRG